MKDITFQKELAEELLSLSCSRIMQILRVLDKDEFPKLPCFLLQELRSSLEFNLSLFESSDLVGHLNSVVSELYLCAQYSGVDFSIRLRSLYDFIQCSILPKIDESFRNAA